MALTDLTRISTSGIATGTSLSGAILHGDAHFRGTQVGVTSALFDSSDNALEFNDNVKLTFGNNGDLKIYHDTSNGSYIQDVGHGQLRFLSNDYVFYNAAGNENLVRITENIGVSLYDGTNTVRLATNDHGVVITGILTATSFSGGGGINAGVVTCTGLDVNGNGDISGNLVLGGDLTVNGTTTTLDTNLIGVDRIEVGANSNTIVGVAITQSGSADLVRLYDGASQVVTVDDIGQVGIGTIAPNAVLHVEKSGTNQVLARFESNMGTNNNRALTLTSPTSDSGSLPFTFSTGNSIQFKCDTHVVTIDDDANVGIGTDNPGMPLHLSCAVQNAVKWQSSDSDGPITHYYNGSTHLGNLGNSKGVMSSSNLHFGIGSKSDLLFGTKPSGGGSTVERLRITSEGKVCVTHTGALHSGNLQVSATGADAIDINAYSSNANSGGRLTFYRSKNASIGSNTIVVDDDSLGRIDFRGYNSNGNSYDQGATIEARVDGGVNSSTDMPTAILFKTSNNGSASPDERLRIAPDGDIVINNSSPAGGKLEVNTGTEVNSSGQYHGEDFAINIRANRGQSPNEEGNGICFSQRYATSDGGIVRTGAIVGYKIQGDGAFGGGLKFKTQQAGANPFRDIMRMRSDMIEIPHDNVRLHFGVDGDFRIRHTGSQNQIYGTGTHPIVFSNSGGERLRITSGGSVGIGLTNPEIFHAQARTLVLQEDGHCGLTIDATSGTNSSIFFADGADGSEAYRGYVQYTHSDGTNSDYLTFGTEGNERLRITSTGAVNIGGQANPSSGEGKLNVKPSSPDSYFKIRNAADFDGTLTGNVIDNRTSDNATSRDLIVRSMNLVLWQETTEKVRITSTGLVRIGGATANSADIDSTHTKLTIKQTANNREDGIYIERSGERRGHYIYVGGGLGQSDALCFATNQLGGDTDLLAIDRDGDVVVGAGNFGVGDFSSTGPRADVHIVSSTPEIRLTNTTQPNQTDCGKIRITEYENSYMGGYMHYDGSANVLHFGVHESNDSSTSNDVNSISIDRDTGQVHLRYDGNTKLKTTNSGVDFDSGTSTLVKVKGDSAGTAGLRCGGDSGQGQCTGYVEVHQDETHGGGIFYNGDGVPGFATHESADYFSLYRATGGSRYSVMRWYHSSQDCEVQGNMTIDNGYTSGSTLLTVRADSSGTAGVRIGGDSSQSQCTGFVEVHQDESHGGGIFYNGDGSPSFASGETADRITYYRMTSGSRYEVFNYPHNSNNVEFNGSITQNASDIRLKTNIKIIDNPIEKIKKIRGTTFDWVDDITSKYGFTPAAKHETGVIAQEIQDVVPDAVVTAPFNTVYTEKSGKDHNFLTVKPEKIIPLCIEAIKELSTEVENLKAEIAALKSS